MRVKLNPITNAELDAARKKIEESKKKIFIDMDNVLVDFQSGIDRLDEKTKQAFGEYYDSNGNKHEAHYDDVPGIFALMDPMPGAIDAVQKLRDRYNLYILSTAPWRNPTAWCDKLNWVKKYFGAGEDTAFYKRIILTHNKGLCNGDYLIDDRPDKCGVGNFKGEVIYFGSSMYPDWDAVVEYFMRK